MTKTVSGLGAALSIGVALGGCNSLDQRAENENEPRLVIPLDERAPVTAKVAPPPISGGTLSVLSDDSAAIVADPDRDRISIVDLTTRSVRKTIELQHGDEPGRSVEDGQKHVHVALRSGGAVVSIDPATGSLLSRRAVCKAPRGIAFEPATDLLHVACAEGKLISLPARGGEVVRSLSLGPDLRDVLVRGSELWITRFKSAEVLRVSSTGTLDRRVTIPQAQGSLSRAPASDGSPTDGPAAEPDTVALQPGTAWRAISNATGGAMIVHQETVIDEIPITPPSASGSAYGGGGFVCDGIVKNVLSTISVDGSVSSIGFMGAPLPVDIAISRDQNWIAVAHAGTPDFSGPRPFVVFPGENGSTAPSKGGFGGGSSVSIFSVSDMANGGNSCAFAQGSIGIEPATAVAFTGSGLLLVQTREPAQLLIQSGVPFGATEMLALGGEFRADTGHELFHRDAGGGIACASCHPEGGEDGHTWRFSGFGERRTQALHVGLRGTAPFHWNGDLPDVGALMSEVFVGRMGGVREHESRVSALSEWLFALKAPPPIRAATDEAVTRGKVLFESADVGCTQCHSGSKFTDNRTLSIDSVATSKLQVPSLVAVGYRAPFMHNGCAATLAARFDAACGGNQHGNTAALSEAQRGDLVAYLESL